MASQKLIHAGFWARMDRATRHVEKFPDWIKGSPCNERTASSARNQRQTSVIRSTVEPATVIEEGTKSLLR